MNPNSESKYDFDLLFKKSPKNDLNNLDIFKKAALLYQFNTDTDFNEFDKNQLEALKENSFRRPDNTSVLRVEDRLKVLTQSIGKEKLKSAIKKYDVKSEFSNVISKIINSSRVNPETLSDTELFYALNLTDIFPEKLDFNHLQNLSNRNQLFEKFERLIVNFAGREEILDQIKEYINWIPNQEEKRSIESKQIILWKEKSPFTN